MKETLWQLNRLRGPHILDEGTQRAVDMTADVMARLNMLVQLYKDAQHSSHAAEEWQQRCGELMITLMREVP